MSERLRIAAGRGATLPLEVVTSATAILGQRGTGKTNAAGVIVEEVVRAGAHVAVLDPVGAWWGITRKGAKAGLRGIVLGGEHGDVPLEETAGALVARLVLDRHWPVVVVDMKLLRKGAQLRFMADYLEALYDANRLPLLQAPTPVGSRVAPASPERAIAPPAAERAAANGASGSVSGPQQRILNALAWLATVGMEPASRLQVAMVAGYHERTKGFTNGLGSLRSGGLIDYPQPGMIQLEAEGRARAEAPSTPLTDDELQRMIYRQVGGARERILRAVLAVHPGSISRAELAAGLGYHERTKGFTNGLGSLRSLGLIEYPMSGYVAVTDAMFVRQDRRAAA